MKEEKNDLLGVEVISDNDEMNDSKLGIGSPIKNKIRKIALPYTI